ncbi:hypothetical protein BDZ89DRAFT_1198150 [Hymenopellis radicata]|nr:hypothetical protein BDZ89DRAFT_1198150 [Hymenopellis radicata]
MWREREQRYDERDASLGWVRDAACEGRGARSWAGPGSKRHARAELEDAREPGWRGPRHSERRGALRYLPRMRRGSEKGRSAGAVGVRAWDLWRARPLTKKSASFVGEDTPCGRQRRIRNQAHPFRKTDGPDVGKSAVEWTTDNPGGQMFFSNVSRREKTPPTHCRISSPSFPATPLQRDLMDEWPFTALTVIAPMQTLDMTVRSKIRSVREHFLARHKVAEMGHPSGSDDQIRRGTDWEGKAGLKCAMTIERFLDVEARRADSEKEDDEEDDELRDFIEL